jgi:hypothetical protein
LNKIEHFSKASSFWILDFGLRLPASPERLQGLNIVLTKKDGTNKEVFWGKIGPR